MILRQIVGGGDGSGLDGADNGQNERDLIGGSKADASGQSDDRAQDDKLDPHGLSPSNVGFIPRCSDWTIGQSAGDAM